MDRTPLTTILELDYLDSEKAVYVNSKVDSGDRAEISRTTFDQNYRPFTVKVVIE